MHCIVEVRSTGVYVKDCGSRNGIWVAGRRVEEALLSSRDEVVVEHFRIKAYMVWGNTVANRFSDRAEEKTRIPGASRLAPQQNAGNGNDLARDTARPTLPSKGARAVKPVKPSLAPTAVPVKAVAKKAAPAPVPAAKPALDETNALPVATKPVAAARGTGPEGRARRGKAGRPRRSEGKSPCPEGRAQEDRAEQVAPRVHVRFR